MRRFASHAPELLAEAPDVQHAVGIGHLPPEFQIVAIGFGGRLVATYRDGPLARHRRIMIEQSNW